MTEIYLMRHSHVDYSEGMAITADNRITDLGRKMAQRLAARCETLGLQHLFASTMPRARETADAIARRLPDLPRTDLRDLEEVSIRDLEDYPEGPPEENIRTWQPVHFAYADARTWERMARAWEAIEAVIRERGLERVGVVSHAAAMNALLRQFLCAGPARRGDLWFELQFTSISCLRLVDGVRSLGWTNDARHVEDLLPRVETG